MQNLLPENITAEICAIQEWPHAAENGLLRPPRPRPVKSWLDTHGCFVAGPAIFLLGLLCFFPACADIYSYTDSDGAVELSNMPTNRHAQVFIRESEKDGRGMENSSRSMAGTRERKQQYDKIVEEVASAYGMDSALLHAVISVESNYNPNAVSKKGASGLMQLMPLIAKHYGVVDILDPLQNLQGGAQYLRDMLALFNNDVSLAVAAYNAGETVVMRYGNRIPPFHETMVYVPKVLNLYREYQTLRPPPADRVDVSAIYPLSIPARLGFFNGHDPATKSFSRTIASQDRLAAL